jgi:hypothetical protein
MEAEKEKEKSQKKVEEKEKEKEKEKVVEPASDIPAEQMERMRKKAAMEVLTSEEVLPKRRRNLRELKRETLFAHQCLLPPMFKVISNQPHGREANLYQTVGKEVIVASSFVYLFFD